MDLLPSVDLLRDHLMAHDRAVREIIMLDQYIEQLSNQTFLSSMGEHMTPAYKHMIRISVAEGMKRIYKEYRLKKWLKITEMASTVRRVLSAEMGPPEVLMGQPGQLIPVDQQILQQPYQHPNAQNMQLVQPALSPIPGPLLPMISPINTPAQTPDTIISRRHVTGTTPEEFHQFTITNISANEEHLSGRQLFQEDHVDMSVQYNNTECDTVTSLSVDENRAVSVPNSALSVANVQSLTGPSFNPQFVNESVNIENFNNQSGYPMIPQQHQQQQQYFNEIPGDIDEMEWDEEDDDEYNDSMESLAGVLFATEHLLPDEQAVRLDVEMGDMGVGHMVFDRVSATWYIQHCEYYRAS